MALSGKKLRVLRESLGLTPAEGAAKAGFSENYLLQLESGRRPITARALLRLRAWPRALDCVEGLTVEELEERLEDERVSA